jgi:hypothetical protein
MRTVGDARAPAPAAESGRVEFVTASIKSQDGCLPFFIILTYGTHVADVAPNIPRGPLTTHSSPTESPSLERSELPSFERFE